GVIEKCLMYPGARIVCVREVQRALKESVKRLLEDKIITMGVDGQFGVLFDTIITPGNGIILFQGMADHTAESIKSLEGFDVAYVEEAQTLTSRSLELLRPTIRKKGSELWFSWNPRNASDPVDKLLRGPSPPSDSIVVRTNYRDNPFLPEESEIERAYDEIHSPQRYAHIWDGEYEPQAIGAIWTRDVIERNRVEIAPEMNRILIGVDPPGEKKEDSDKCGLVAGGLGEDGRGYVLQDESMQATPEEWGRAAVAMYDLHDADAIVAEVNYGGDMVRAVIHSIRSGIKVIKVRAKRGKHLRAEPVSSLYSLNRISHIGNYPELERQMCLTTADSYKGDDSPDNMDACVYIFLELFNKMIKEPRPKALQPVRAENRYRPHRWREHVR
ncbi:MAG: hypothetical protein IH946_04525, partial [Bacteroidetes bacterium]|nr:hypothetical protein [Bacteroidota bacterium]